MDVSRRQVLQYRAVAQGLHRPAGRAGELAVLDLGVQDTNVGSARVAVAARLPDPPAPDAPDDDGFTLTWATRGAPHLHRTADLPWLAPALWPVDDADALARLGPWRKVVDAAGIAGLDAFRAAASALREVVTGPTPKGEASAGVTARVPPALSAWCGPCDATHVSGGLFQQVGLAAGTALEPGRAPAVLVPLAERFPVPERADGTADLVRTYLRLQGPASPAEVASHLGTNRTAVRSSWPDDLAEVTVDGRRAWLSADQLDLLGRAALPAGTVRLLPPADPFLQGRDRDVLVPDRSRQKSLWRAVGSPGAVLVDGEVAGTWRARTTGGRLTLTVEAFDHLSGAVRAAVDEEADRLAVVRGADGVVVDHAGG